MKKPEKETTKSEVNGGIGRMPITKQEEAGRQGKTRRNKMKGEKGRRVKTNHWKAERITWAPKIMKVTPRGERKKTQRNGSK